MTTRGSCCWVRCWTPPTAAFECACCSTMRSASTVATLRPLAAHPNIEIRIFNPFLARHEFAFLRGLEYLLQVGKLDYRMHNKLFVGDNAIAVTGGRSIGDEYFQASGEREFGDFDLAVAGPMVKNLSRTFDLFWNDRLAIPVETQPFGERSTGDLAKARAALAEHRQKMVATSVYYSEISRRSAGRTFCPESVRSSGPRRYSRTDSPDKASVESPARSRRASTPSRTRQTATRSSWPREARRTLPWSNGAVWRTAAW